MHIGIVSPININILKDYIDDFGNGAKGYKGATAPSLLIEELLKKGHKISVFTLCPELEIGSSDKISGKRLTIYVGSTRKRVKHRVSDFYQFERSFLKAKIREVNPDVLHAHWQYEYAWAALDFDKDALVTCRDSPLHVLRYQPSLFRFIRLLIAIYVLYRAKNVSATSIYLAKNIRFLSFKKNILLIPNFEPNWLFLLYKSPPDHSKNHKIVMINNGFGGRKNVGVGIKAFQIFRVKYPNASLHLYGAGFAENGEAHKWIKENGLNTNVYLHGVKDFKQLMGDLSQYHLLLHTAHEETFGNILSEAMSQGIPVIGGNKSGAVPWVIGDNNFAGILTDITSPDEVAEAIGEILKDETTYTKFS